MGAVALPGIVAGPKWQGVMSRFRICSVIALSALLFIIGVCSTNADPYRWCAQYDGRTGGENCGFVTFQQCQAAISDMGGFCRRTNFYTNSDRRGYRPRDRKDQRW
jgi:hypothetical protein